MGLNFSSFLENTNQHRTPFWVQIVGVICAVFLGAIGSGLIVIKLFRSSKGEGLIISFIVFMFGSFLLSPHFIREHQHEHTKFSKLTGFEKLNLLVGLIMSVIFLAALAILWVRA